MNMDGNASSVEYHLAESMNISNINSTQNETNILSNSTIAHPFVFCLTPYCIPNALITSIISIGGIIANMMVMVIVKIDKRLHQPTFVAIVTLALPDFTFLVSRYIRFIIDGYFAASMSKTDYWNTRLVFDLLGLVGGGASVFHIVLLSVIRYFIIVHPLKSHVILTNKVVLLISLPLWIVAIGNGSFYLYAVMIKRTDKQLQRYTNTIVTLFMTIFPVVVIATLHLIKARVLLNSLSSTEETVRRMSRVITFVICSYLITTTPMNVCDILNLFLPSEYTNTALFFNILFLARVLLFLNYAINPFIYFLFSPQFKRFFSEKISKSRAKMKWSSKSRSISTASQSTHFTNISLSHETYRLTQTSSEEKMDT